MPPPLPSLPLSHTHSLSLSFKMPQGTNKCQAVPVHWWLLSPKPDKQGCRLAGCPLPLLAALRPQAAERKSGQQINSCCGCGWATGQAAARHPVHVRGTWPWVNWQMPGLWVRLKSDVTPRVLWPYCTGHTHIRTHTHALITTLSALCSQSQYFFKHLTKYFALALTHTFQAVWLIVTEMAQLYESLHPGKIVVICS